MSENFRLSPVAVYDRGSRRSCLQAWSVALCEKWPATKIDFQPASLFREPIGGPRTARHKNLSISVAAQPHTSTKRMMLAAQLPKILPACLSYRFRETFWYIPEVEKECCMV